MACNCNNRQPKAWTDSNGCLRLNLNGRNFTYCPEGVNVACDPNGEGILINGQLCSFPDSGDGGIVTDLEFDNENNVLTLRQENGPPVTVNLADLADDHYVESATFDSSTSELVLNRTGGLPPLTVEIPSDATELPEGVEGQVVGYDEDGQPVAMDLPEPPADEDHYVESAAFDEETRILTLTRTDPLDPLTVEIPSEFQFPETGTPFFLLQRGAAGGVLTEGRLFLGTLSVTSAYPDDAIVPAVQGGAVDTAAFGRLRATADPDRITLAKRGDTGTLKAAEAVEPDDLVTLSQLPDPFELPEGTEGQVVGYGEGGALIATDLPEPPVDEDHYVESVDFNTETRQLTLTRTDPLAPLSASIPSDATELPEGQPGQVIGYDNEGDLEAVDLPDAGPEFQVFDAADEAAAIAWSEGAPNRIAFISV